MSHAGDLTELCLQNRVLRGPLLLRGFLACFHSPAMVSLCLPFYAFLRKWIDPSKAAAHSFIYFLCCFSIYNTLDFCLYFYYFLPSACLSFILLFFFEVLEARVQTLHFRLCFFSSVCIYCHKFSFHHCFSSVPSILICFIFIFFSLIWFVISLETSSWTYGLFVSVLFCFQVSGDLPVIDPNR